MFETKSYLYIENAEDLDKIYRLSTDFDSEHYLYAEAIISKDCWCDELPIVLERKYIFNHEIDFEWRKVKAKELETAYTLMEDEYYSQINYYKDSLKVLPTIIENLEKEYERLKSLH